MFFLKYNHFKGREWLLMAVVLMLSFLLTFFSRNHRLYHSEALKAPETAVLLLHENVGVNELIEILIREGVVFNPEELRWASDILRWRRFTRGRYVIDRPLSYPEFLSAAARGLQDPMRLVIPAGAEKKRLLERISDQMSFDEESLAKTMNDPAFLNRHQIKAHHLYGRLLPDTYEVYWTSTPERLLDRLLSEFDRKVTQKYSERMEELGFSVDQITTLASIIEWEARYDDEKATISGLYWNRLNRRWRLQADPTVNYAKGERSRLVYQDYRLDHPYNTYRFRGLPPGPITNPSYSSIRAALFPEKHNYMYMVARPDGFHAFSQTYAEHRRKSREWTDWLREQRRIQREQATKK